MVPHAEPIGQGSHGRALLTRDLDPSAKALDIGADVVIASRLAARILAECDPPPREGLARMCWELVRHEVEYIEETGTQYIRLPWRTLADGRADCKSQTTLIVSVCAAAGCNAVVRMVILPGTEHFGHVYAVIDGVPVDPGLEFGQECPYISCLDVPITV